MTRASWGLVTFCAVVLETFGGLSTEGMTLFKTVIGRAASHTVQDRSRPCAGNVSVCSLQGSVANAILATIPKCDEDLTGDLDAIAF